MYLRSLGLLGLAAASCLSLLGGPAMAESRVLSTQGNEQAAPANVLSTEGNQGAAPARVISTKDLATPEQVRKSFQERFPDVDIVVVKRTRFPGLFEVQIGMDLRSEEHTSELQSLMRISYAVFCLKKKITQKAQS